MLKLPLEILAKIVSYIPVENRLEVSKVSTQLNQAVNLEFSSQEYLHQSSI